MMRRQIGVALLVAVALVGLASGGLWWQCTRVRTELQWQHPAMVWIAVVPWLMGVVAWLCPWPAVRGGTLGIPVASLALLRTRTLRWWLAASPWACTLAAATVLAAALARPQTFTVVVRERDSIDIMLVFDLSKSMEETDLPRDRLDAAQRVVRHFLRRSMHDRVGLVVFAERAMLQCPLTSDAKVLEQMVADLRIGDVPALGTAIGDGLALSLAQLRKSDAKTKVVVLLSDGDSNIANYFEPTVAADAARQLGVRVFTVLVGKDQSDDWFADAAVDPETLRTIAKRTGGAFFRATDEATFADGFAEVRKRLDTNKRIYRERRLERELYGWFAGVALLLWLLGWGLRATWLRWETV